MTMTKKLLLLLALSFSALNAEYTQKVKLPNISFPVTIDENFKVMQRNCQWCHSFGYIVNQEKQSYKFWTKVVTKMKNVYKAPINDSDKKTIVEYLFKYYGNGEME